LLALAGTSEQLGAWMNSTTSSSASAAIKPSLWLGLSAHLTKMAYTVATARRLPY
jgi:hypothetical protein